MAGLIVEKVDHEHEPMRGRLIDWLTPHESHALFILGNLATRYPRSHVYVARRGDQWVGITGYYERPRGLCPFSADPEAVRAMVRHAVNQHPVIEHVNAIDYAGLPAVEEMRALGYSQFNEPRQVFMESEIPPAGLPHVPHQEKARVIEPRDGPPAARLMRYLQRPGDTSEITPEEIERVTIVQWRMVLEVDGEVVSTASTNGVGVSAFQILGVATDEKHRGKGYARAVCAALIRRMQAHGARRVVLFTDPRNVSAQRCYEKLGFRITGDYCMAKFKTDH